MKTLEMKKCKECGKLFMPISNKQKYCLEKHYRPCPVCGKPVFAKYLSDPARCCSGVCKSKLGKLNKEDAYVAEVMEQKADLGIEIPKIESVEVLVPMPGIEQLAERKAEVVEDIAASTEKKKYAGADGSGWTWGHVYAVTITQEGKEHVVRAKYDYTSEEFVDSEYRFTNKKKISTIFKASK